MNLNPAKTSVVVVAHPDLLVAPELMLWLLDIGIPRRNILISRGNARDQAAAYNWAVSKALTMPVEACLFADNDIRPDLKLTAPLLAMPFDFTCARTETETGMKGWREEGAFHSALWLANRAALARVPAPWFQWTLTPDGAQITDCVCVHFAKRAKAAGCTIGNAGWAQHYPRARPTLPDFTVLR